MAADILELVVVAWPDKLCFHLRDCEDIYRPSPPSSHRRQTAFDDPLGGDCGIRDSWDCVLVYVDVAMPASGIFLAKTHPRGLMHEHRQPHRYRLGL